MNRSQVRWDKVAVNQYFAVMRLEEKLMKETKELNRLVENLNEEELKNYMNATGGTA